MKFTNLNPLAQRNGRNRKKEEWIWSGGSARVGSDSAGAQALNLGEGNHLRLAPHDLREVQEGEASYTCGMTQRPRSNANGAGGYAWVAPLMAPATSGAVLLI